ncbi:MAG: NAD(P)-dependent oxidoreductase [Gammaproteobacteria bacterium]
MPSLIAITGATGFVGHAVSHALIAAGYSVQALVRNKAKAAALEVSGVKLIIGGLENATSLRHLVKGVDAVIHCAGNVRGARAEHFNLVNIDGTAKLFEAIQETQAECKVMVFSSLAAREPELSYYAASKAGMESWLFRHADGIEWMAIRPPAIYGPGDKELLPLFKLMAKGFAPVPGNIHGRFSMIFIDDLVSAVMAWLKKTEPVKGVFAIEDGHQGYDWQEVANLVGMMTNQSVRLLPVPGVLLDGFAVLNRSASRLFGYLPMLTPEKLRELRHSDWVCTNDKISEALNWQPEVQLLEGLQATSGWLPASGSH